MLPSFCTFLCLAQVMELIIIKTVLRDNSGKRYYHRKTFLTAHKCFLMLFTKKTLDHQVGLPPSCQYVATLHCTTQQIIDWIIMVMHHGDGKQHKKTLVWLQCLVLSCDDIVIRDPAICCLVPDRWKLHFAIYLNIYRGNITRRHGVLSSVKLVIPVKITAEN